jgi:hypothetical protein
MRIIINWVLTAGCSILSAQLNRSTGAESRRRIRGCPTLDRNHRQNNMEGNLSKSYEYEEVGIQTTNQIKVVIEGKSSIFRHYYPHLRY